MGKTSFVSKKPVAAAPMPQVAPAKTMPKVFGKTPAASQQPTPATKPKPVAVVSSEETAMDPESIVVSPQNAQLSTSSTQIGKISGQAEPSDFNRPRIGLAQFIGPLSQEHGWTAGDVVLDNEYGLFRGDLNPVLVTVVEAKKEYVQDLPYDSEERPLRFESVEAVHEAGFSTNWGPNKEKPEFLPELTCGILLAKPETIFNVDGEEIDCPMFDLEIGDQMFALALWTIRGVAYSTAARTVFTLGRSQGLHTFGMYLSSAIVSTGKYKYFVPTIKRGPNHSAEFVASLVEAYTSR